DVGCDTRARLGRPDRVDHTAHHHTLAFRGEANPRIGERARHRHPGVQEGHLWPGREGPTGREGEGRRAGGRDQQGHAQRSHARRGRPRRACERAHRRARGSGLPARRAEPL
ncbi:MAG: Twin-arginine translocation protein TatA, partial [uncultured Rubrobacteraceae bacterium]